MESRNSERQQYLGMIEDLRDQVINMVRDLPAEALNWRPVQGDDSHATNSLAVLATHVAGAERFWMAEVIAGYAKERVRDQEFVAEAASGGELAQLLERVGAETRRIFEGLSDETLNGSREARDRQVPVRWAILHVIDHTALHLGHMELTLQLWRGGQSHEGPRWFQRV